MWWPGSGPAITPYGRTIPPRLRTGSGGSGRGGRSRRGLAEMRGVAEEARADGLRHALVLGMGGSSLAPEVLAATHDSAGLTILDTTHPDAVVRLEREIPLRETLFIVSSKSGTTIQTRSHMAHFLELVKDPTHFVAITDPNTPLEDAATELGFRHVFAAPPDVGGRYSALTVFGLVPGILGGTVPEELLEPADRAAASCGRDRPIEENPGAVLGAAIGEAALAGRDKATLAFGAEVAPLG